MKLRRRDIIKKRQQEAYHQLRKTFLKKVNVGVVALASGSILTHLTQDTPIVSATNDGGSQGFSKSQFLDLVAHSAQLIAGENDLYASVMIAQAALESGWGNSGLASAPNYNLFGIKGSYNNQTVVLNTLEDDGTGHYYQIKDGFRKYNNYAESLQDYANLLTGQHDESNWRYNYYYGARRSQTQSYQDATAHLTGRYATDTSYAQKLNRIIIDNNLTRYDVGGTNVLAPERPNTQKPSVSQGSIQLESRDTHRVQRGDSYWAIAKRYNVSLSELQALNNNAAVIYPGQDLRLPKANGLSLDAGEAGQQTAPQINYDESTHVVQPGESYWAIARQYNVSVHSLQEANGNAAVIHPGQQLVVPQVIEETVVDQTASELPNHSSSSEFSHGHYTVKPGDTMWRIAQVYGMNLEELKQLNNTASSMIQAGQTIQVINYHAMSRNENQAVDSVESFSVEEVINDTELSAVELSEPAEQQQVESQENQIVETVENRSDSYTVEAGDTLYSIAKRNGLDVYQLIESNGSTLIKPGQVIKW